MKVINFMKTDMICLDMKSKDKEGSIRELGEYIRKTGEVKDHDKFMREVFEREKLVTTGIGNELAIPHARTNLTDKFLIVFGRSTAGVDFESFDKRPAKLIFLMAIPSKNIDEYLVILAHLTRILKNEELLKGLYSAETNEEAIDIFKKAEE